ncbi:hypothetical protein LH427_09360 [Laribacter hongkongensis]|uniref:hypothetical protein n=1 Tax=Laribacter hongkongensis TaxID=168471 RepID=UPI001EFEE839|nr:hypothetical protein [Laribacter hongkongensis]MCG8991924.1 hypothetical protein [Laribacter hongkongensis]MCG8997345.1 hypothetical protein [Laribacter hongkongensis]MCG9000793.1 hypothetical protein [Laribacter hongkongensis]MCG9005447.1 hypothetical protein [Laribacter hongkongensis]MCG9007065.1 hypothetical protein [Laribacter hongkongensis]
MKFAKYISRTHINSKNIAVYTSKTGAAVVKAENVVTGEVLGTRKFQSVEQAQEWFDNMPGNELGMLLNALDQLTN